MLLKRHPDLNATVHHQRTVVREQKDKTFTSGEVSPDCGLNVRGMDCVLVLESHIQHPSASSTVLRWISAVLKHVPDISVFLLIALMEGRHFKDLIKAAD